MRVKWVETTGHDHKVRWTKGRWGWTMHFSRKCATCRQMRKISGSRKTLPRPD